MGNNKNYGYSKIKKEQEVEPEIIEEIETVDDIPVEENKKGFVNCNLLNVRKEATKDSEVLKVISENSEVDIFEEADGWFKVKTEEGIEGYCMSEYITVK